MLLDFVFGTVSAEALEQLLKPGLLWNCNASLCHLNHITTHHSMLLDLGLRPTREMAECPIPDPRHFWTWVSDQGQGDRGTQQLFLAVLL